MLPWKTRSAVVAGSVALVLLGAPSESKAIFDWLCPSNWCGGRTATTTFMPRYVAQPVAVAPVCNPCAPQTAYYVPQTCYRTVYSSVPVTSCSPITTCDPCTGCPVTTYRPVTTYALRPTLVPYTSYRIVYAGLGSASLCSPCAPAAATYSPVISGNGCAPCAPAPAVRTGTVLPSSSAPASLAPGPATFISPSPSSNGGSATTSPGFTLPPARSQLESVPGGTRPELQPSTQSPLKPIPDPNAGPASLRPPPLTPPDNRTAVRPLLRQAAYFSPIPWSGTAAPASTPPARTAANEYEWHAAH